MTKPSQLPPESRGVLYYGDNLDVLHRHVADESIDLIYLYPPFKSNQSYNVLFAEKNGTASAAQIQAFEDTWHWDQVAAAACQEVIEATGIDHYWAVPDSGVAIERFEAEGERISLVAHRQQGVLPRS